MAIPAFVNLAAGTAQEMLAALEADASFDVRAVEAAALPDSVREAVSAGARRIAVSGGDGTIARAASALVGTPAELAILPGGTLNHLARDCGIPTEPDGAVRVARDAPATTVDVAYVNDHLFHGTSSVGAYVTFVRTRERLERWFGYRLATILALIRILLRLRTFEVQLEVDGVPFRYRTALIFVGVGEREPALPKLGSRVERGKRGLHVIVVRGRTRARMLAMAFAAAVRGRRWIRRTPSVDSFIVDRLRVDLMRPGGTISVDGELIPVRSPLDYRLVRDALKVVAPGGPATPAAVGSAPPPGR